jgi:hypothetical protein
MKREEGRLFFMKCDFNVLDLKKPKMTSAIIFWHFFSSSKCVALDTSSRCWERFSMNFFLV